MGARFIVETKQLQRILATQRIVPAFKCGGVDRQRADNFVFLQLPAGGNLCESAGVDFNFAGRGFERMRFRIAPEVAIGDEVAVRVFALVDAHSLQILVGWQRRIFRHHFGVQILQPLFLGTPLGKTLMHVVAEPFRHFA